MYSIVMHQCLRSGQRIQAHRDEGRRQRPSAAYHHKDVRTAALINTQQTDSQRTADQWMRSRQQSDGRERG